MKNKTRMYSGLPALLILFTLLTGCGTDNLSYNNAISLEPIVLESNVLPTAEPQETISKFSLDAIPEYSGNPYVEINNNIPYFTENEITNISFETYSPLDSLGRCGAAVACVGQDIMPTEERGAIGMVKPSGWHTVRYDDIIDGKYLYNRCHLIAYQLSGENANEQNLITGTCYLNIQGMLPFENMVADYVKETNNHVMYRVTPIFNRENLLARGVLMEGYSVEDGGGGICYNVFCYNVQPGITIDYATGDSSAQQESVSTESSAESSSVDAAPVTSSYIGNKNTKKLHRPECSSVEQMNEKNKDYLNCTLDEAIDKGYEPCKRCIGK